MLLNVIPLNVRLIRFPVTFLPDCRILPTLQYDITPCGLFCLTGNSVFRIFNPTQSVFLSLSISCSQVSSRKILSGINDGYRYGFFFIHFDEGAR